jgi:coatomer protein complex subunit alpha (xenin)
MLTKFETKSNRVKGLAFHSSRPWVLASLHNGVVQLWDYRMGTLIDRFDEHDGPVRGVCFHQTQPLFVTGGDDYKIKVWNYKLRRCLFSLLGHLDYIRTVQFHPEHPWIVSASDDQTVRIWNWQQRSCVSVLTGHNHYVMCAQFHPKDDLVLSASLDQTVRVWDIAGLRKKTLPETVTAEERNALNQPSLDPSAPPGSLASKLGKSIPNMKVEDLFGGNDATVKYVLEGHDRGVNWASFHSTLPLIVSGADDRQVKLWRMNETKAWEVDTLRGHINNVSCALFHPKQELIISNSEDKSIRVWDMSKRQGVQTFRREHDRFWILAVHQESNLLAAGHDGGMIVFKLERERPAFTPMQGGVLFVKDRYVRSYDYQSGKDTALMSIRRSGNSGGSSVARSVHYNEQESMLLVCLDTDGGSYELYSVPRDGRSSEQSQECKRGAGTSAVFVARQRFAVLDKNRQILIKNFQNEVTKKCAPPHGTTDCMFPVGTGLLLLRSEERVSLFDVQQRKAVAELGTPAVKYVVWSPDNSNVALLSKHGVVIANKRLEQLCMVHETIRIKSGAWDGNEVFVYSTLNHIKYCLVNGDNGIIRTLDVPVYISRVSGGTIHCLDREGKVRKMLVDVTECQFKLSLHKKEFERVIRVIKQSKLSGHAIIAYLQKKGYPQVALHFVSDEQTRFNLAVECGNIEIALQAAQALDNKENWHRLGAEALKHGNHQVVEMAYQRTKDMEKLSFLYLITGNVDKLKKMLKIAEMRSDVMARFHNALYLGDVPERVKLLTEAGHVPLAYITALTYGLNDQAEALAAQLTAAGVPLPEPLTTDPKMLYPALPITRESNWPLLTISKGTFERSLGAAGGGGAEADSGFGAAAVDLDEVDAGGGWGDDDDLDLDGGGGGEGGGGGSRKDDPLAGEAGEGDGWGTEELDLGELGPAASGPSTGGAGGFYVAPTAGMPLTVRWSRESRLATDHAAAGSFESAMQLLQRQYGLARLEPLRSACLALAASSQSVLAPAPSLPILMAPLMRPGGWPNACLSLASLVERLKSAYGFVTAGKFAEAHEAFKAITISIALALVNSRQQVAELKELLGICREYTTGLRLELLRKTVGDDKVRVCELAAYFTHCNLQPAHLMLALRSAMTLTFKAKLKRTAASFARRLLELNPKPEFAQTVSDIVHPGSCNALPLPPPSHQPGFFPLVQMPAELSSPYYSSRPPFLRHHRVSRQHCPFHLVTHQCPLLPTPLTAHLPPRRRCPLTRRAR